MRFIKDARENETYRELGKSALLVVAFFVWCMFNRIFLFLPPMIGVLFVLFMDMYQKRNIIRIVGIVLCLVLFEAQNQLPLGVLPLVFLLARYMIVEKFNLIFGHSVFFVFWYVGVLYLGYFLVLYVFSMFGSGLGFHLHRVFVLYFLCESFIALFYEKFKY